MAASYAMFLTSDPGNVFYQLRSRDMSKSRRIETRRFLPDANCFRVLIGLFNMGMVAKYIVSFIHAIKTFYKIDM